MISAIVISCFGIFGIISGIICLFINTIPHQPEHFEAIHSMKREKSNVDHEECKSESSPLSQSNRSSSSLLKRYPSIQSFHSCVGIDIKSNMHQNLSFIQSHLLLEVFLYFRHLFGFYFKIVTLFICIVVCIIMSWLMDSILYGAIYLVSFLCGVGWTFICCAITRMTMLAVVGRLVKAIHLEKGVVVSYSVMITLGMAISLISISGTVLLLLILMEGFRDISSYHIWTTHSPSIIHSSYSTTKWMWYSLMSSLSSFIALFGCGAGLVTLYVTISGDEYR